MANDVANANEPLVPDYARKASIGGFQDNLRPQDFQPPRLKLLAGQSPEVMQGVAGAVPGNFWMTILNQNLGKSVTGTPIWRHVSYNIWSPNREQKAPLATSSDGVHWDVPNQVFEVRFPNNSRTYTWRTMRTVEESGLGEFGSSQDDNPRSRPAAAQTFDYLWMIDMPDGGRVLCAWTNAGSGVNVAKKFNMACDSQRCDMCLQRYRITVERATGPTPDIIYFTYNYTFIGTVKEDEVVEFQTLAKRYNKIVKLNADAPAEATNESESAGPRPSPQSAIGDDDIPF